MRKALFLIFLERDDISCLFLVLSETLKIMPNGPKKEKGKRDKL